MIRTPSLELTQRTPRRNRGARLLVGAAMIVVLVGCAGKTEDQIATDELNAGLAASTAGQQDQAVLHYQACLKHNSLNEFCIYNLGVISARNGDAVAAENAYRLAMLIDPNFPSAIFNLALLRASAGSSDEAIQLYRRYTALRPDDAGGHLNLGLLLRATGQTDEASKELALALKLDPKVVIPSAAPVSPSPSPTPQLTPPPSPTARPSATP